MTIDDQLAEELRRAIDGLLMMSEGDHPFEVVSLNGSEDLTPERLGVLTGSPAGAPVATQSVDEFFGAAAGNYDRLVRVLKERLADARVYRCGERNVGVLLVGRTDGGSLLGVATRVVET